MLTAVIHAGADPSHLALTLSALVPAVAEGLMSHAVVVRDHHDASSERIADAMGASLLVGPGAPWQRGAGAARGEWVLLLNAGEDPEQGWIGAVERHLMTNAVSRQRPALLPLRGGFAALRERLSIRLSSAHPCAGLIAPRMAVAAGELTTPPVRLSIGRLPPVA